MLPPLCSSNGCSKTVNLNCFAPAGRNMHRGGRPAGSIKMRLRARGGRADTLHRNLRLASISRN